MLARVSKGKIPASPPADGTAAEKAPANVECPGGGQNSGAAGKSGAGTFDGAVSPLTLGAMQNM